MIPDVVTQTMVVFAGFFAFLYLSAWLSGAFRAPQRVITCTFCKNDLPVILAYHEDVNWKTVCEKHLETKSRIDKLEKELLDTPAVSGGVMEPLEDWYKNNPDWKPDHTGRFRNTYVKPHPFQVRAISAADEPDEMGYDITTFDGTIIKSVPARPRALAEPERIYK